MGAFTGETFLEKLIRDQRRYILYYLLFTIGLVLLGGAVIAAAFFPPAWFTSVDVAPDVFKIAGAFVSSLGGFQVREILDRKARIQTFLTFKGHLADLKKKPKAERTRVEKQLEDLMWKYIEKAALG
jgi:hypothetical protein